MRVYIDKDFKCHTGNSGGLREAETEFFEGKWAAFVEGYRYIPEGETWTRSDGESFRGEMFAPWQDSRNLEYAQAAYEQAVEDVERLLDMQAALDVLGVQP